jgi:transmembrane sensor
METKIRKYFKGKATREEILSLISWLEDEENRAEFKRIKNEWKANPDEQDLSSYTLLELDKFKSKILNKRAGEILQLKFIRRFYKYAAILLLFVALGSVFFYISGTSGERTTFYNTIIAENGQISKAMLPDHTVVWLNSGSSLKYSNRFGVGNRNVELTGQAYFDVTKNKNLPFVVSCDEINVKVLGTQFTAEAYPEDREINVVLVEGAVELTSCNSDKTFARLRPDEMLVYNKQEHKFRIDEVVAGKYTSWREGTIHIYDQPLKEVVAKLQKRYNQQIILGKGIEDYKVTFSVRNEDFNDVLDMLLSITAAKAHQEGEIIYLDKK